MVQRWDIEGECSNDYCPVKVEKNDGGDFVEFNDYATLASENESLKARVRELEMWIEKVFRVHPNIDIDIEALSE